MKPIQMAASALMLAAVAPSFAQPQADSHVVHQEQIPGSYRFAVGAFQVVALSDGTLPLDVHAVLTGTTKAEVDKLLHRSFLANPVETSINAYLIDTGDRILLVDTGAGELFGPAAGGKLVKSLAAAGYRPDQIDDVLITHIHTDHSGGLAVDGKLVFPNATIHVGKGDVDFFLDRSNARKPGYNPKSFEEAERTVAPYLRAGKVRAFDRQTTLFPGVTAIPTPGHTPGHSFYRVESRGERIEFWGDLLHVGSVQFPKPRITVTFDVDPAAASRQRIAQFTRGADERALVAASHLPYPGVGYLRRNGAGYGWVPIDYRDRAGN